MVSQGGGLAGQSRRWAVGQRGVARGLGRIAGGGGGSVVCVSAALGPSTHPPFDPSQPFPTQLPPPYSASYSVWMWYRCARPCTYTHTHTYVRAPTRTRAIRIYRRGSLCITPYKHYFHVLGERYVPRIHSQYMENIVPLSHPCLRPSRSGACNESWRAISYASVSPLGPWIFSSSALLVFSLPFFFLFRF